MPLTEEERNRRFQEKYGVIDLHTAYVSLSHSSPQYIDPYSVKVTGEAVLNIEEYNQPFEANFSVGLNGTFLSLIKQIYFNVEYKDFSNTLTYNQIDQQCIVSRDEIKAPVDADGILQLNGEIPELIAPTRGFFTVSFIFEIDDPELDEDNPTYIGYNICRVPVQVPPSDKNG